MSPSERDADPDGSGALERAAAILDAFDEEHRELTLAALVRRCGLPRSTTHRTAEKMLRLGWLDKPERHYRIGNRLFELSGLAPVRHQLREAVLPFLQDLHSATRTTVQLGVLRDTQILVVEKITGHRALPMLSQVGGLVPAHCSALGRAILAYSSPEVFDHVVAAGLQARTPNTLTTEDALRRELAAARRRGWAEEREEGNQGLSCVAAPVFGPLGEVAAAISVTGPSSVVQADRLRTGGPAGGCRSVTRLRVAVVSGPDESVPVGGTVAGRTGHRRRP